MPALAASIVIWGQGDMEKCMGCGRSFLDDERLRKHQVGCSLFKQYSEAQRLSRCASGSGEKRRIRVRS